MTVPRLVGVACAAALAVAGAATSVVMARRSAPEDVPLDALGVSVAVTAWAVVGVLVSAVRRGQLVGVLMALGAACWGVGEGLMAVGLRSHLAGASSTAGDAWMVTIGSAFRGGGWLVLILVVPFVFPDGRPPWPSRRFPTVLVVGAISLFTTGLLLAPTPLDRRASGIDSPTGLPGSLSVVADLLAVAGLAACVLALLVAVAGLVHRWRSGDRLRHQQITWLGAAFAVPVLFLPVVATDVAQPWMFALVSVPVPVSVAVALLQRRLYDLHEALARTVTWIVLSAGLALLYAATVAGVGVVLDEQGSRWLPWLGAGVVAVSFAPLRDTLQRAVTRLVHGRWAEPAEVLGSTARRLTDATDVPGLLASLALGLGDALHLERVEIRDLDGRVLASSGDDREPSDRLVLTAFGLPVGELCWASDRTLREGDRRLLADVAGQLGGVVHTAALVDTLRLAQHRLVLAREEERRRLRRDLHDGLGPELASLTLRVDDLRNRWHTLEDPDARLVELRDAIQSSVVGVRRIVEGLRPAQLEMGLAAAVEHSALRIAGGQDVDVTVEPLPPLPAAVEVAVFRVVNEALANACRHAGATRVSVSVRAVGNRLLAEVGDDGVGTLSPRPEGVGLQSMHDRAEELGGRVEIDARPGEGTCVRLDLPIGVPGAAPPMSASRVVSA